MTDFALFSQILDRKHLYMTIELIEIGIKLKIITKKNQKNSKK